MSKMEAIIVGDPNCKFLDVARIMVKSPGGGELCKNLGEVLLSLEIDSDVILDIKKTLSTGFSNHLECVVRALEVWRSKNGKSSTVFNLVSILNKCDLREAADGITSAYGNKDSHATNSRRFVGIPEAVILAQKSLERLLVITTKSPKLLCEWIEETGDKNLILSDNTISLSIQPESSDKLCIVTITNGCTVSETIDRLKVLNKNKIALVIELQVWDDNTATYLSAVTVIHHELAWKNLTHDFQQVLVNKTFLIGQQGTALSQTMEEIGCMNLDSTLNDEFLTNLINGTAQLFPLKLPPVLNYYIERKLIPRNQIDINIFKNKKRKDVFVFTGLTRSELSVIVPHETCDVSTNQVQKQHLDARFIILILYSDFQLICEKAKTAVHWLQYHDERLAWMASKGKLSTIQENVLTTDIRCTEELYLEYIEGEITTGLPIKSIIHSDSPGMGKTVLLAKLARSLSEKYSDRIVVFVRLEEFLTQQKTLVNRNMFDAFLKYVCNNNNLSETILWNIINKQENSQLKKFVEILIDGFDEVDATLRETATKFLKTVQTKFANAQLRMWVTTRPHLLDMLENLLGVVGFNIEAFQKPEQIRFLQSFWKDSASQEGKILEARRLEYYSGKCLSTIQNRLGPHEKDIAGIPLQCLLIAETYSRSAIDYCDLANVVNHDVIPGFDIYKLTDLYKHLIDMKFNKYQRLFSIDDGIWEQKRSQLLDLHIQISLDLIFPGNFKPLSTLSSNDVLDLCNVGIVESSESVSVPRFIHRTFAEYFVAKYIVANLVNKVTGFQAKLFQYVFNSTGNENLPSYEPASFNLQLNKISFQQKVVCFFIDHFLAQSNVLPCEVDSTNLFSSMNAAISENCILLFKYFTGNFKWINYIIYGGSFQFPRIITENKRNQIANILFSAVRYSSLELIRSVLNDFKCVFKWFACSEMPDIDGITLLHVAVKFRDFAVVRELIQHWYQNVQEINGLLHFCISDTVDREEMISEKVEIIDFLCVKNPILINTKFNGLAAIHVTNVHPKLESKLFSLGADISILADDKKTLLHKPMPSAIHLHNLLAEIISIEKRKSDCRRLMSIKDNKGFTPLHFHICKWALEPEILNIFRDLGADFNSVKAGKDSIISSAIRQHQNEVWLRLLIDYGTDINWRGKENRSLLHVAIYTTNIAAVKVLLERGLDVNVQDKNKNTPLHHLIIKNKWTITSSETIIPILVQYGARLYLENCNGKTPLDLFESYDYFETRTLVNFLKILHKKQNMILNMNLLLNQLILRTTNEIAEESLIFAKELVQEGAELTISSKHGNTLLFSAMNSVYLPLIKWLVRSGLDVHYQNLFGDTPLHHLMTLQKENGDGEYEVFIYLQKCGVLINKRNFENQTVMDIAIKNEKCNIFVEMCKTMAASEVNFCKKLAAKTLLKLAAGSKFPKTCDFIDALVKNGVDVNHKDDSGNTVLHIAAQRRSNEWVNYFLALGANPQIQNDTMRLPVHMLYLSNTCNYKTEPCFEVVEKLLPKLNNVIIGVSEWIKLYKAACFADVATFNLLLANGTYHNYLFSDDFVWFVMGCRSLEIISSFCDAYQANGFNLINLGLSQGTSALHVAAIQGESEIVEYLLDKCGFNETLTSPRMTNLIHKLIVNSMNDGVNKKKLILKDFLTRNKSLVNQICEGIPPLLVGNIHLDLIKQLVDNGADVTAVSSDGDNLAHLAVQYLDSYDFYYLVEFLVDKGHGFLFQTKGKDDCTVLHRVVSKWNYGGYYNDALDIIKKTKADFNAVDKNGHSVLVHAVKARCNSSLYMINDYDVSRIGCLWSTLFTNVSKDDTEVMLKHLIFKHVDVSKKDSNGDCIQSLVSSFFDEETASCWLKHAKGYTDVSSQLNTN